MKDEGGAGEVRECVSALLREFSGGGLKREDVACYRSNMLGNGEQRRGHDDEFEKPIQPGKWDGRGNEAASKQGTSSEADNEHNTRVEAMKRRPYRFILTSDLFSPSSDSGLLPIAYCRLSESPFASSRTLSGCHGLKAAVADGRMTRISRTHMGRQRRSLCRVDFRVVRCCRELHRLPSCVA